MSYGSHVARAARVPDCSFGLAVGDELLSENLGSVLTSKGVLNSKCLKDFLWHWKSGLISDPKLLNFSLAFPWAVYEAKKDYSEQMVEQIERASEIYLRLLNDLVLQPGRPETAREFQTQESSRFQIFSFTSEGPNWKVYVCYRKSEVAEELVWMPAMDEVYSYVRTDNDLTVGLS